MADFCKPQDQAHLDFTAKTAKDCAAISSASPVRVRRAPTFALSFAAFAKKYFILSLTPMGYTPIVTAYEHTLCKTWSLPRSTCCRQDI